MSLLASVDLRGYLIKWCTFLKDLGRIATNFVRTHSLMRHAAILPKYPRAVDGILL